MSSMSLSKNYLCCSVVMGLLIYIPAFNSSVASARSWFTGLPQIIETQYKLVIMRIDVTVNLGIQFSPLIQVSRLNDMNTFVLCL